METQSGPNSRSGRLDAFLGAVACVLARAVDQKMVAGEKVDEGECRFIDELCLLWHILRMVGAIGVGVGVQRVVFKRSGISPSALVSWLVHRRMV
jgi:hypothetical protein